MQTSLARPFYKSDLVINRARFAAASTVSSPVDPGVNANQLHPRPARGATPRTRGYAPSRGKTGTGSPYKRGQVGEQVTFHAALSRARAISGIGLSC